MKPHIKYSIISVFLVLLVEAILLWLFLPSFLREPKAEPLPAPRAEAAALSSLGRYTNRTDYSLTGTLHATEEAEKALTAAVRPPAISSIDFTVPLALYQLSNPHFFPQVRAEGPYLLQIKERKGDFYGYTCFLAEIVCDYTEAGNEGKEIELYLQGTQEATLFPLPSCGDMTVSFLKTTCDDSGVYLAYDSSSIAKVLHHDGNFYAAEVYHAANESQEPIEDGLEDTRKKLRIGQSTPLYSLRDYEDMLLEKRAAYDNDPFVYEHFFDLAKAHLPSAADALQITEGMSFADAVKLLGKPHGYVTRNYLSSVNPYSSTVLPQTFLPDIHSAIVVPIYPFTAIFDYCCFTWSTQEGDTLTVDFEVPPLDTDVPDVYAPYGGIYAPHDRFSSDFEHFYAMGWVKSVSLRSASNAVTPIIPEPTPPVSAACSFDIDGDGEKENCVVTMNESSDAPTFSVLITERGTSGIRTLSDESSPAEALYTSLSFVTGKDGITRLRASNDEVSHLYEFAYKFLHTKLILCDE